MTPGVHGCGRVVLLISLILASLGSLEAEEQVLAELPAGTAMSAGSLGAFSAAGISAAVVPEAVRPWGDTIRVALVRDAPQIELGVRAPFRIIALSRVGQGDDAAGSTAVLLEGRRLKSVSVRATSAGIVVGPQTLPAHAIRVEPQRDATITLNGQRLRGALDILRTPSPEGSSGESDDLTILVINRVGLEDYLRGVLSKEAPHQWPLEALKAIAIAARTYTVFQQFENAQEPYDVTGDVLSQVYGGKSAERWRTSRAVRSTEGKILVEEGRVFPAFYHSTCGGMTESGVVMGPYGEVTALRGGMTCSWCTQSKFYRWQRTFTRADIGWALVQHGYGSIGGVTRLEVVERTPTGRIATLRFHGRDRAVTLKGYDVRAMFGFERLRSTAFTITGQGDQLLLRGQGWGHGVGLCQWGTEGLARRGRLAEQIVAFYYPQAKVVRLQDTAIQPILVQEDS